MTNAKIHNFVSYLGGYFIIIIDNLKEILIGLIILLIGFSCKIIWSWLSNKCKKRNQNIKDKKLQKQIEEAHADIDKHYIPSGELYIKVDDEGKLIDASYCPICRKNYDIQKMVPLHDFGKFKCNKCRYKSKGLR